MDKINELKELKELIENLKQEKLDNEKDIEEIKNEENNIEKLEQDIRGLCLSKFDIRLSIATKVIAVITLIFCIVSVVSGISLGKMGVENIIRSIVALILGGGFFYGIAYLVKYNCIKEYCCSSLKEIRNKIEEKEKQKELIKSKSEANKEILIEKEQRQIELNEEIEKCATELSKYEAVKDDLVNKFLNSPEFIQAMNSQMSMLLDEEQIINEEKGTQKTLK